MTGTWTEFALFWVGAAIFAWFLLTYPKRPKD